MTKRNLPPPYKILLYSNSYSFHTDQDLTYVCGFNNIMQQLSPLLGVYNMEICDIVFFPYDPHPEVRKTGDDRVSATVSSLIKGFFDNENRVLLYICDMSDGRAKQRQTLFRQWHGNLADTINSDEVEIEVQLAEGVETFYGGILTRKDFPYMGVLKAELFDPARGVMAEKFGRE